MAWVSAPPESTIVRLSVLLVWSCIKTYQWPLEKYRPIYEMTSRDWRRGTSVLFQSQSLVPGLKSRRPLLEHQVRFLYQLLPFLHVFVDAVPKLLGRTAGCDQSLGG